MRKYTPDDTVLIPKNAKLVFSGKIFDVYQWPQELFDGTTETFEMLSRKDTVKIIAIKDGKIVITRQKQPRKKWFYDFPGGRNDSPKENELDAAKREMAEETGMVFRSWRLIEARQPFVKIDWMVYTFLATDFVAQGSQNLDGGELIEVEEVSFAQLKKLANTERRFLENKIIKAADSLDDLLNLPAVYNY
ncbi:NUDIX hydrolase [Candidatus Saccharibacteria bacterium]|nr:NUDIX hydrolase [Candidatus Saccharibacteria bacterium]